MRRALLLGAGALAGNGRFNVWLAAALALAGTVLGDLVVVRGRTHRRASGPEVDVSPLDRAGHLRPERGGYPHTSRRERALDREIRAGTEQHRSAPGGCPRDAQAALRDLRRARRGALGGTLRRSGLRAPRPAGRGCPARQSPGRLGHRDRRGRLRTVPGHQGASPPALHPAAAHRADQLPRSSTRSCARRSRCSSSISATSSTSRPSPR